MLLQSLLDYGRSESYIEDVVLHVHVLNEDAIHFYTEKFGFAKGKVLENHYRKLNPPHGLELRKSLRWQSDCPLLSCCNEVGKAL